MQDSTPAKPTFALSDKTKERLRRVDEVRPYLHRAALFGLPAMGVANYMTAPTNPRKALIVGATGLGAAGLGLLDRKIESLAEEHEELRPTLKHYSKNVAPSVSAPTVKAASAFTRVRRNREELSEAFPLTAAARPELQKEALISVNPKALGGTISSALGAVRRGAHVLPTTVIGGGIGAMRGASQAEDGHGLSGAIKGGLLGAGAGFAASKGLQAVGKSAPVGRAVGGASNALKGMGETPIGVRQTVGVIRKGAADAQALGARRAAAKAAVVPPPRAIETTMEKLNGMDTTTDAHRAIGGRPPYALLTLSAETSNDAVINQMLRGLFANTDAMRKATEEQVLAAFPLSQPYSYGRHRAIGRTAEDIKAEIALAYTPTKR
jgi:hypothetical protein